VAQIRYRVSVPINGKRVTRKFRTRADVDTFTRGYDPKDIRLVYDARVRVGDKELSQAFKRRKDADAWAATMETNRLRGVVPSPSQSKRPFRAVAEEWLAAGTMKRASSVERDRAILMNHVYPSLGDRPLASITRADVQAIVDSWAAKQSPSTVGRQYSCFRAVFGYAEAAELMTKPSPCGRWIRTPAFVWWIAPSFAPTTSSALPTPSALTTHR